MIWDYMAFMRRHRNDAHFLSHDEEIPWDPYPI